MEQCFIDGAWKTGGGAPFASQDPSTGAIV